MRGTPDPLNGHFVRRCATASPTGMLHEDAIDWARRAHAQADRCRFCRRRAFRARRCATGMASPACSMPRSASGMRASIERLATGGRADRAGLRHGKDRARRDTSRPRWTASRRCAATIGSDMFTIHSAKFFLDGVLENRTARDDRALFGCARRQCAADVRARPDQGTLHRLRCGAVPDPCACDRRSARRGPRSMGWRPHAAPMAAGPACISWRMCNASTPPTFRASAQLGVDGQHPAALGAP